MRLASLLPALALGLISGCGGGSSSSSTPAGPTQQEKAQALGFTSSLVLELSAYYSPDAWTPPALAGGGSAALSGLAANAFTVRGPSTPFLPLGSHPITPCAGTTTTGLPDPDGYLTAVTDFASCTDGTSGQVVTRWKQTADFFDLAVSFNGFTVQVLNGSTVTTETMNGSISVVANHSGTVWSAHYHVPSLVAVATSGGSTVQLTHTADFTETFTQTSAAGQPVVGNFSVYGSSAWDTGAVRYSASVAQGTPLLWQNLGLPGACAYPVSGRIVHSINAHSIGVTFTSACGIVRLDDGASYDLSNF